MGFSRCGWVGGWGRGGQRAKWKRGKREKRYA